MRDILVSSSGRFSCFQRRQSFLPFAVRALILEIESEAEFLDECHVMKKRREIGRGNCGE
jgi:hypothetical protein